MTSFVLKEEDEGKEVAGAILDSRRVLINKRNMLSKEEKEPLVSGALKKIMALDWIAREMPTSQIDVAG